MGNKLRRMLDQKDNGITFTLNFENLDDRTQFINAINKSEKTGTPQNVPTPQSMEIKRTTGEYQYPFKNVEKITNMMVCPSQAIVDLPITVDGVQCSYSFIRTENNGIIFLNTLNPKVVEVKIEFKASENIVNFNYTSHPGDADSMDELIQAYKRFLALAEKIFRKDVSCEKIEDVKKHFKHSIKAFSMAKEIGEALEINLTPKRVIEEDDEECLIEKLYLLLIEDSIIRQEDKLNHIDGANIENAEIGQELFATYFQSVDLEIFEEHKTIYTVNCIFGAEIQDIKYNKDGNSVVYFKDSEQRPMYRSYSAYLDKNEAEEEINNIMQKREQYENAVSWQNQLREMMQE